MAERISLNIADLAAITPPALGELGSTTYGLAHNLGLPGHFELGGDRQAVAQQLVGDAAAALDTFDQPILVARRTDNGGYTAQACMPYQTEGGLHVVTASYRLSPPQYSGELRRDETHTSVVAACATNYGETPHPLDHTGVANAAVSGLYHAINALRISGLPDGAEWSAWAPVPTG